jgi:Ras GTPase-activating protein-binding protein 1
MDSAYPDPGLIGKAFVKQYYTQLHHDPSQMHRFYLEQSSMVHGGSELGSAERVIGQKAIHEKILSMNLQQVHAKIKQVDSDLTLGQGITIQVTGELSTAGRPMRAFVQTFVLAPESPKKYYVRNDFFRYQDDDLASESETNETPGEGEGAIEPPQERMDTYLHQQSSG